MKTLPALTVALALLTSTVQAQEPTLTLSNGKVFNAAMVEAMGNVLESMVKLDKLSSAVLTCYINITDEGDSGAWNPESLYPCLETENLAADYLSMKGQADSQLVAFVKLARAVEQGAPGAAQTGANERPNRQVDLADKQLAARLESIRSCTTEAKTVCFFADNPSFVFTVGVQKFPDDGMSVHSATVHRLPPGYWISFTQGAQCLKFGATKNSDPTWPKGHVYVNLQKGAVHTSRFDCEESTR